ncbi:TadE/TadG family type IV pilus assembly protein [Paenarthrobacter ureafaciens]|uniref:TadE/TadG family type IV pilus assembly protein n=1 Tax=Paenarthrobacter TaxID=1742992 RepID=UPI0022311C96|nr:TadE family protein [Paenarthrobacter sp. PAE-2]MCW3766432.1 pilus assembly protein [Paenarthrobacter sp. PAE-2]
MVWATGGSPPTDGGARECGSAVVDFVLVGGVLTLLFMSVIQLMLVLHVRNLLIDAAASGARYGALADRTPADAVARTNELIGTSVNSGFGSDISTREVDIEGRSTLEVTVKAPLPIFGLIGPGHALQVTGHAVITAPRSKAGNAAAG